MKLVHKKKFNCFICRHINNKMNEQSLNIKFVGEVEKRPVLYDYKLPGYSRKDVTEKAWSEVGKEVDMTVGECKERWKNLRAVFVRHMKPPRSGSGSKNKKPYYLSEVMQFTIPFIKSLSLTTGNLMVPQEDEDMIFSDSEEIAVLQNSECSLLNEPPSVSQTTLPLSFDHQTPAISQLEEKSTEQQIQPVSVPYKRKSNAIDNSIMEYFQAKKLKIQSSSRNNINSNPRSEALRMFLLSLLPDLESLNNRGIQQFKRRTLETIDEILSSQNSNDFYSPTTSSLSSTNFQSQHSSRTQYSPYDVHNTTSNITEVPQFRSELSAPERVDGPDNGTAAYYLL